MSSQFLKDPDAVLDYEWDWSGWLEDDDVIISATVAAPDGLVVDRTVPGDTEVTAWLSGGTEGTVYRVTCHIVTLTGREDDRTIVVNVISR